MPDRTTKVTLTATVSNYLAGMEAARVGTVKLTKSLAEQRAAAAEAALKQGEASKKIGTAFLSIGAAATVATALAIKEFADFDAKMSQVATLSHANAADMALLSTAALHAGQKIGFTANEVADAEIEMVKAGISVKDILGGALPGALQLAAAGQIDVAQATEIATIAMTQFKLKGKDIPHVADLLAAGADKALGGVSDLGEALKSGGLVAAQFGISLDDTIGTLSAFANAGLLGETAGTDLRQMLLKLAKPAHDAAVTMKDYGITVYDASGNFVGLSGLAGELKTQLGGLSNEQRNSALATIFGSRAIAGANVLYNEGAAGIDKWNTAVNASGFAQQQATGKMDNLNGDLKKLQAAFQTDVIESGSGANGTLREMTQLLTGLVSGVGQLPQPLLQAGLGIGAVAGGTALLTGGFLRAVPALAAAKATLASVGLSGRTAAVGIGAAALALTGLVAILSAVAQANADAVAKTNAYGDSLDSVTHKATGITRSIAETALAARDMTNVLGIKFDNGNGSAFDAAQKLGISLKLVTDAATGNVPAMKALHAMTDIQSMSYAEIKTRADAAGITVQQYTGRSQQLNAAVKAENDSFKGSVGIAIQKADADKKAAVTSTTLGAGIDGVTTSADKANTAVSDLVNEINNFGKTTFDARAAQRDFQQAVDDATAALKKNKNAHGNATAAGREDGAALDDVARKTEALTSSLLNNGASNDVARAAAMKGRAQFIQLAEKMGQSKQAAEDLAAALIDIPSPTPKVTVVVELSDAEKKLGAFHARLLADLTVPGYTISLPKGVTGSGVLKPHADGGLDSYAGAMAQANASFAGGGVPSGVYAGRAGGIVKFAEPETGWELYISGKKSERVRNRGLLMEGAARLGMLSDTRMLPAAAAAPNYSFAPPQQTTTHVANQSITFVNPVVQNPADSARQASQVLLASMMGR
jgi:TP901 family phage tail tape measure protein